MSIHIIVIDQSALSARQLWLILVQQYAVIVLWARTALMQQIQASCCDVMAILRGKIEKLDRKTSYVWAHWFIHFLNAELYTNRQVNYYYYY